jgi:hypothetical protein
VARVARGYSRPFTEVLDQDWADTLVADLALDELERVDQLLDRGRAVDMAALVSLAMHQPGDLAKERRDLELAMRRPRQPTLTKQDVEQLYRQADRAQRIARRNRRKQRAQ